MDTHFANFYDHCPLILQVSTFILLKVLLNEVGLHRCCDTRDPFYAIAFALQKMVSSPDDRPSARLLKCIIRCYLRLFDHPRFVPAVIPIIVISFHTYTYQVVPMLFSSSLRCRGHAVLKTRLPSVLQTGTFNDYLMVSLDTWAIIIMLLPKFILVH